MNCNKSVAGIGVYTWGRTIRVGDTAGVVEIVRVLLAIGPSTRIATIEGKGRLAPVSCKLDSEAATSRSITMNSQLGKLMGAHSTYTSRKSPALGGNLSHWEESERKSKGTPYDIHY